MKINTLSFKIEHSKFENIKAQFIHFFNIDPTDEKQIVMARFVMKDDAIGIVLPTTTNYQD